MYTINVYILWKYFFQWKPSKILKILSSRWKINYWGSGIWLVLFPEEGNKKGSDFPKAMKNYKSMGKNDQIECLKFLNWNIWYKVICYVWRSS